MSWETVIGLEIHAQLATRSKIFSGAATAYGAEPNTQACLVDLGYPGVLPVLNAEVVRMALKFGLAIGASIAPRSVFARKNYFYPDLPKGYQISQYELPIVHDGRLAIELEDGSSTSVHIIRAHLAKKPLTTLERRQHRRRRLGTQHSRRVRPETHRNNTTPAPDQRPRLTHQCPVTDMTPIEVPDGQRRLASTRPPLAHTLNTIQHTPDPLRPPVPHPATLTP